MSFSRNLLTGCLICLFILSCSGNGGDANPVEPGLDNISPITDTTAGSNPKDRRVCWGIWEVTIDKYFGEIEIVPVRGASFEANVVNFLQPPSAPIHLLTIQIDPVGTSFPDGRVACTVTVKHPFPGTKFCGFDVLGIVMGDHPGYQLTGNPDIETERPPNIILENADGYTRWWNEEEFTTYGTLLGYIDGAKADNSWTSTHTLNPYKYFCDGLGAFDAFNPAPELRGFFSSVNPGINKRRYELQFPMNPDPTFHFKYAVSASWVSPYDSAQAPYHPDDFPPDANVPEAYKISFVNMLSDAYWQTESIYGGDLNLFIEVRDWQLGGNPSAVIDEIASVRIESPTLFPDPVELDLGSAIQAPGNPEAIWIAANFTDVTPIDTDNQLLIVTVESANIKSYEPQIPGITGFDFPDGALAAYNIFEAPILNHAPGVVPPVADAGASYPLEGDAPLEVNLDPSNSHDQDGYIIKYEWDFEGDGVYDVSTVGPDIVNHTFYNYENTVVLKVTDNDLAWDKDEIQIETSFGDEGWRMYHANFARDGRTDVAGPNTNNLKFALDLENGAIKGGLAIDSQQRILLLCTGGNLYCISQDGEIVWSYFVGGYQCDSSPSVGVNDSVFVGSSSGTLWHIDKDGELIWSMESEWGRQEGGIAFLVDETIIYGTETGYLVKVDPDGNELWHYGSVEHINGGPAVGPDGRIYIASMDDRVRALDQDGNEIWVTEVYGNMNAAPALGPGGIYIGDHSGYFYRIGYDGSILWEKYMGSLIKHVACLSLQSKVVVVPKDGTAYCLDAYTGSTSWSYQLISYSDLSAHVMDGLGRTYVGDVDGYFHCIDSTGQLVWEYDCLDEIWCKSPAIAEDGTIYTGNDSGTLYAFHD